MKKKLTIKVKEVNGILKRDMSIDGFTSIELLGVMELLKEDLMNKHIRIK